MSRDKWSRDQEQFLIDNFNYMEYKELAKSLRRSTRAIYSKACRLKLTKKIIIDNSVEGKLEVAGRRKMENFKFDIKVGQNVKILVEDFDSKKGNKIPVKGKVIFKNNFLITLRLENYNESFTISDFYTKHAVRM